MKWWRRKEKVNRELPPFVGRGLLRFNQKLIRFASYLGERSAQYSRRRKVVLLFLFVVMFFSGSVFVVFQSIEGNNPPSISITRVKALPMQEPRKERLPVSKATGLKVMAFKRYIDSLGGTASGRKARDSLLQNRPRLMDSVKLLIKLYLEQSKIP